MPAIPPNQPEDRRREAFLARCQTPTEACRIGQNLARSLGYAVFPVGLNKAPTRPKDEGGSGFRDASTDPECIAWLWRNWPGELVGIATGKPSGITVLDIDVKHDAARAWWKQNQHLLPATRTYRTRGSGLHLYFRAEGVRSTVKMAGGKPVGLDVMGEAKSAIFWFGAGYECLDDAPPAPWPEWLTRFFWPPPKPEPRYDCRREPTPASLERLLDNVRNAAEGSRNHTLFKNVCFARRDGHGEREIESGMLEAAITAGLERAQAQATIRSAFRRPA